jgi:predicted PurR-regulated permease PerM
VPERLPPGPRAHTLGVPEARAGKAAGVSESRITPGVLYRAVLLAFGLVIAALIVKQLLTLVLAVLIVVILALPLSACATFLQRFGVPRAIGAILALLVGLAAVGGLVALTVPVFTHEVNQFVNSLPSITDALRHRLGKLTGTSPSHVGTQIQQFVNGYTHHPTRLLGPLEVIGASVAAVLAAVIVVLLTALYTAIHPDPLRNGLVRLVTPSRRFEAEQILDRLRTAYLGWLRGLVIGMIVLGTITYVGLRIVGLDFAEFFAVFTAVAMIVPYFGALASSIPPILYALTYSPEKAILVAIIYVIAHQIEGNVIEPLVVARTVQLHPALVAVGVVAVEQLFGPVGLIVAVPIIATVKILIEELWVNPIERRSEAELRREPPPRSPGELVVGASPLRRRGT